MLMAFLESHGLTPAMSAVAYISHHCPVILMAFLEGYGLTLAISSGAYKSNPCLVMLIPFLEGYGPTLAISVVAYIKGHDTLVMSINVNSTLGLGLSYLTIIYVHLSNLWQA